MDKIRKTVFRIKKLIYSETLPTIKDGERNLVLMNASLNYENILISEISKNKELFSEP